MSWKRPFFTLWIGQAFSLLGSQLVQFALVWWLTRTTGSAAVLATASLVALLPNVLLSPVAGTLIDRWNRRTVMLVADSGIALATLALIGVFAVGEAQPWIVYLAMLVRAVGGVFHMPAMNASTSLMVPKAELGRVQGMNAALNGSMTIVAPPLGALLIEALPMQTVLAVDIVTAALGIGALALVHVPQPVRAAALGALNVRRELAEALRYMRGMPGMMILVFMAVAINFVLIPAGSLLPLLVKDHFRRRRPGVRLDGVLLRDRRGRGRRRPERVGRLQAEDRHFAGRADRHRDWPPGAGCHAGNAVRGSAGFGLRVRVHDVVQRSRLCRPANHHRAGDAGPGVHLDHEPDDGQSRR